MTIPIERRNALINTEDFLVDLLRGRYKRVPVVVRERAAACLRHYPSQWEVSQIGTKFGNTLFQEVKC